MIPVGTGLLSCGLVVLQRPWADVRAFVPKWLTLPPGDTHPVVLMIGEHRDVCIEGTCVPDLRYHEALISVPRLRLGDDDGPVAWIAAMYLSRQLPVVMGLPYGFPKRRASVRGLPDTEVRLDHGDEPLLRATFHPHGPSDAGADTVAEVFDQPYVCQLRPGMPAMRNRMVFDPARRVTRAARCEGHWRAPHQALAWRGAAEQAWLFTGAWRLLPPSPILPWSTS